MERSARFVAVLPLRHGGTVANEFSKNRDRLFAGIVEPINTYAVIGVGIFRDLEHIGRSGVVKFHGQRIRCEDVVGNVTALLSGDVFIVVASAMSAAPTKGKIALATSQGYFTELLCRICHEGRRRHTTLTQRLGCLIGTTA